MDQPSRNSNNTALDTQEMGVCNIVCVCEEDWGGGGGLIRILMQKGCFYVLYISIFNQEKLDLQESLLKHKGE